MAAILKRATNPRSFQAPPAKREIGKYGDTESGSQWTVRFATPVWTLLRHV